MRSDVAEPRRAPRRLADVAIYLALSRRSRFPCMRAPLDRDGRSAVAGLSVAGGIEGSGPLSKSGAAPRAAHVLARKPADFSRARRIVAGAPHSMGRSCSAALPRRVAAARVARGERAAGGVAARLRRATYGICSTHSSGPHLAVLRPRVAARSDSRRAPRADRSRGVRYELGARVGIDQRGDRYRSSCPSALPGGREPRDAMLARMTSTTPRCGWMNAHLPPGAIVASEWPDHYLDRRSDLGGARIPGVRGSRRHSRQRGLHRSPPAGVTHLFRRARDDE